MIAPTETPAEFWRRLDLEDWLETPNHIVYGFADPVETGADRQDASVVKERDVRSRGFYVDYWTRAGCLCHDPQYLHVRLQGMINCAREGNHSRRLAVSPVSDFRGEAFVGEDDDVQESVLVLVIAGAEERERVYQVAGEYLSVRLKVLDRGPLAGADLPQMGPNGAAVETFVTLTDWEADEASRLAALLSPGELPCDVVERRAKVVQRVSEDQREVALALLQRVDADMKAALFCVELGLDREWRACVWPV